MRGRRAGWLALVLLTCCWLLGFGGRAAAQDAEAGLAEAQESAAAAAVAIPDLKVSVTSLQGRLDVAKKHAAPVQAELRAASARAASIKQSLRHQHEHAVTTIQRIEREREKVSEEHDVAVRTGIGLGIAALVLAAIALGWDWFRASAAIAYLARMELGQAIGLCVGGGLLTVVVGGALSSADGILGAIGYALLALGFALPVAFVLARHSAEVQRGQAKPHLRRDRLPARITQGLAGLFAALFLLGLGSAVFAGEAESGDANAELRARAADRLPSSPALADAESEASQLEARAAAVLAVVRQRQAELRFAKRRLGRAHTRLTAAEQDERHFTQRLAAIEERELHEREREEREAQKRAEVEERKSEELAAEECDPNYSGCLDPNASDYDCAGGSGDGPLYTGMVEVLGVDHYGLDEDGDGIGCES